jgi:endoglucanase
MLDKILLKTCRCVSLLISVGLVFTPAVFAETKNSSNATTNQTPLTARNAFEKLTPGINIGNTLENTTEWEIGWGNPPITKEYIQTLVRLGFKSVRVPVAWDTYAEQGQITPRQLSRVSQVVDWIIDQGMYCVINIHWDGGWINSGWDQKYPPQIRNRLTPQAEEKFKSYWHQIATHFADRSEKLIFEALNEESDFSQEAQPYETLNKLNQLFVDTVRQTGGKNAERLLIIAGYTTDIDKTCRADFRIPTDPTPDRLLLSIHYYTPWQFVGLDEDASWGKMIPTWGSPADFNQLNELFDRLATFSKQRNIPVYLGEFTVCSNKDPKYRQLWINSVFKAALKRKMIPVLWDTGGGVMRKPPYTPSQEVLNMLSLLNNQVISNNDNEP